MDIAEWIKNETNRFARLIGATYQLAGNGLGITNPQKGIQVADGIVKWAIPLDDRTEERLYNAFKAIADVYATGVYDNDESNKRTYGIWLDVANGGYLIESGRIFDDVGAAIDYGILHQQRYIYDIGTGQSIEIVPELISSNGDSASFSDIRSGQIE